MSDTRYPWQEAYTVAVVIVRELRHVCLRVTIAGSLRRKKADVGDIEILYIPEMCEQPDPANMFGTVMASRADARIERMESAGILARRFNSLGRETYGPKNKLMRHVSGIPVDLFAATEENWFNYLVCRTGPADLNKRICEAAIFKGWHWNPYGVGFSNSWGEVRKMDSEKAVFSFVGLPYQEPAQRISLQ
jgi:DNA polymerase/3'-5' exonuclease PolX